MIITQKSNLQDSLTFGHLKFLVEKFADRTSAFTEQVALPGSAGACTVSAVMDHGRCVLQSAYLST